MKKSIIYLSVVSAMMFSACDGSKKETGVKGIDPANLDITQKPGDDFYQFACGGWIAAHPLKPEYSIFGMFHQLGEENKKQVKGLVTELAELESAAGTVAQKVGDLYAMAMDTVRLNREGAAPLLPHIEAIDALESKAALGETLAAMAHKGIYPFFGHYVYADDKNSSMNIMHLYQGGTNMGDRDYYLNDDERSVQLREKYTELIQQLFALAGYEESQAKKAAATVMKLETQLANASKSRTELRDPIANYNKLTLEEFAKLAPAINWKDFFANVGVPTLTELNVGQPASLVEVSKIVNTYSLEELKEYLKWNTLLAYSGYLSTDFSDATFAFYGKAMSGKEEQQERWKKAIATVEGCLGEAIGQLYVEKYFSPEAKERMLGMVTNLQDALGARIQLADWMSEETKIKAMEKLHAFRVKIGYPDKWKDYSSLAIRNEDAYLENIVRANQFYYQDMIKDFGQPVDREKWLMNPQEVNAYYNPVTNEICFPAGILQPPFFNMDADDAVNYGGIGVVIGHEMTHGFDDQGRMFDKEGNLTDWWTPEDAERFNERARVLVDYFNNIKVLGNIHANGELTLGENIADNGGLKISWQAYQNSLLGKETPKPIDNFTDAQRFFLSYSTLWAANIRDEEILNRTKTDPHSLGKWRVNGTLPHIAEWYEAFSITENDPMYLAPEKRADIW